MAWTSMHFAVGMGCAGAIAGTACLIFRRGWRFIPAAMTAGGVWALIPDLPRFFREDFPNLPFASILGDKALERSLHRAGDFFFFHAQLDAQPREFALLGLALILLLYNLSIGLMLILEWQQRESIGNRSWRAHHEHIQIAHPHDEPSPDHGHSHHRSRSHRKHRRHSKQRSHDNGVYEDPVIHRIQPEAMDETG